jgi:hypothetical protein
MKDQIDYLIRGQQDNGSFPGEKETEAVFSTALVLSCLNGLVGNAEVKGIKKRAADFLLSQKDNQWLFSDNVGVNFLVFSALLEYNPEIIDGSALAKILMILTSAEAKEGGPYYSSVQKQDAEVDLGVNIAVAYFLSLQSVDLLELDRLIETAIESNNFESRLFASCQPVIYFISKFYKGDKKGELIVSALEEKEKAKNNFDILFINFALDNLCREESAVVQAAPEDPEEIRMMRMVLETAEKRFFSLTGELKNFAMREIQRTISGNGNKQMPLMAYFFKKALGKRGMRISDGIIARMGLANIFFWTAFIIYDDFWDEDEAADPRILPIANFYARHYVDFFSSLLPEKTGFRVFFHKLMDGLDEANTWETTHCRAKIEGSMFFVPGKLPCYGDYEFKFRPASGHILGPVALLVSLGYGLDSAETRNLISYFRNYLIAMQINDDAHDWEEDLRRGHLSTVVVMLLEDYLEKYPAAEEMNIDEKLQELKELFWFKTVARAAETAIRHADKSRLALKSMTVLEDIRPLDKFIIITEIVAKKALAEQKKTKDFLAVYAG